MIEEQANMQAQKLTLEYLKKSKTPSQSKPQSVDRCDPCDDKQPSKPSEENNEKVFIVYKFIQTPIEAIIAGM